MGKNIIIGYKKPGKPIKIMEIPNKLEEFQRLVEGYIEPVKVFEDNHRLTKLCPECEKGGEE